MDPNIFTVDELESWRKLCSRYLAWDEADHARFTAWLWKCSELGFSFRQQGRAWNYSHTYCYDVARGLRKPSAWMVTKVSDWIKDVLRERRNRRAISRKPNKQA